MQCGKRSEYQQLEGLEWRCRASQLLGTMTMARPNHSQLSEMVRYQKDRPLDNFQVLYVFRGMRRFG